MNMLLTCTLYIVTPGLAVDWNFLQVQYLGFYPGLEVNFLVHLQSFASKIFYTEQTGETTSKFFPNVWEICMISNLQTFASCYFPCRILISLTFCEFVRINFEPWREYHGISHHQESSSDLWDIPRYVTRVHCKTTCSINILTTVINLRSGNPVRAKADVVVKRNSRFNFHKDTTSAK